MKKILLVLIALNLWGVSAFEAGDLDSPNPYGLTKDETYILKNKNDIKSLKKIVSQNQKIINAQKKEISQLKLQLVEYKMKTDNLSQTIEGIKSILEDFNNKQDVTSLQAQLSLIKTDLNKTSILVNTLKQELQNLKNVVDENKKVTEKNIDTIVTLVENIAKKLDKTQKQSDFTTLPKDKIYSQAISLFKKREFKKAKEMFEYLVSQKYKQANSLFYLGEIAYIRGLYKTALAYYKKSISLSNPKAYYIDDILYHSGYSFEKLKQFKLAKKSYLKLINDYPKSNLVKYAKKRLNNLEKIK